jgi:hypothetical protein
MARFHPNSLPSNRFRQKRIEIDRFQPMWTESAGGQKRTVCPDDKRAHGKKSCRVTVPEELPPSRGSALSFLCHERGTLNRRDHAAQHFLARKSRAFMMVTLNYFLARECFARLERGWRSLGRSGSSAFSE